MKWINFLHLYQPPTQSKEILDTVTHESYFKIIELLKEFPKLKLTINMSGSLLELLERHGYEGLIKSFAQFARDGRIEIVGSAMYHPILPLIPETEVREQIQLQNCICQKWFGETYKPRGFYLPEMAYSESVAHILKELGYEWIILGEVHAGTEKINPAIRYHIQNIGLDVIFRTDGISKTFPPESVLENPEYFNKPHVITAHDGELYGHWHKDDKGYYKKAFTHANIEFVTITEYLAGLKETKNISIRDASWESTEEELAAGIPYALWKMPGNVIHEKLWGLADSVITMIRNHPYDANIQPANMRLSRGLASCAWWWASERKLGPFSPITWNPTEIEKGATELLTAARTLKKVDPEIRIKTEKIFTDLHDTVWKSHWIKNTN